MYTDSISAASLRFVAFHLELVLEVGDRPQALDDRGRSALAGELDEQVREHLDLDLVESLSARARSRKALRSSAVNSVVDLRMDWPTTPTTTRSNTRDVRVRMSRCP